MIIYGHSGQDIRRMIWRKKYRILSFAVMILIAVTLLGCTKPKNQLKALDKFWDTLGSGKNSTGVE